MPTWFQEGKCLSAELWVISAIFLASRLIVVDHLWIQTSQPGACGCAAGVVADHPVSLHPGALAFNLKSGGALTGQAPDHTRPDIVAAEVLPIRQPRGSRDWCHLPGGLRLQQPEDLHNTTSPRRPYSPRGFRCN